MAERANLAARLDLARQATTAGRREDAWRILEPLTRQHPTELAILYEAARAALGIDEAARAADLLKAVTCGKPDFVAAWPMFGEALALCARHAEAAEAFAQAIARGPMPFPVYARLAGSLLLSGKSAAGHDALDRAVDMMKADLHHGCYDEALEKEGYLIQYVVRPIESEDHTEACFALWRDAMTTAGRRAKAELPELSRAAASDGRLRVGFFLHAASMLGHVELALDYMGAMAADKASGILPYLYVLAGTSAPLAAAARERGIAVVFLEETQPGKRKEYQRLRALRERAAADGISAMVWITLQHMAHFAAAMEIAPIHVFWAMRFRGVRSPHIHGRIACASCFEREDIVHGQRWDIVPLAFRDLRGAARGAEALDLRRAWGNPSLVFGTFARREKMQGAAWLEAVGRSLRACPQAIFVWAGREEDPNVSGTLAKMGVAAQSRFVGWVDTRLCAQAIDIFLDTAPVGCGMTAMEAMAWGKPLVSFKDPLTNWGQCLTPLLNGRVREPAAKADVARIFALGSSRELLAWADGPADYAEWARRLATDETLRVEVGAAGQAFTEKYFGDPAYAAGRFAALLRSFAA